MDMRDSEYTNKTGVRYARFQAGSRVFWRHVDCNDRRQSPVGPLYSTKRDLMLDHHDYLCRAGWLSEQSA